MEDEAITELLQYFNLERDPKVGTILAGNQVIEKCTKYFRRICTTTYSDSVKGEVTDKKQIRPNASKAKCGICLLTGVTMKYTLTCCKIKCCVECAQELQKNHPCFNKHTFCHRCKTSQGVEEAMFVTACCSTSLCTTCTTDWYRSTICFITGCDNSKRLVWTKVRKPLTSPANIKTKSIEVPCFLSSSEIERTKHLLDVSNEDCILNLPIPGRSEASRLFSFHYDAFNVKEALINDRAVCQSPICFSEHIKGATRRLPVLYPPGHVESVTFTPSTLDCCMICALLRQSILISKMMVDENVYVDPKWYIHVTFAENVNLSPINILNRSVGLIGCTGMFKPTLHFSYWELLSKLQYVNGVLDVSDLIK
ncbi:hypothetical protein [Ranid herpesvirus 3]|uniref:Uncharacterized protein n=1 Tax=Ranid herpesvirus 3 TaxID=1987509 RepID=A0A1X9T5M6_9VIRU|nr:hypothetical protein [Ranid herpesvirus 3]ARR28965.1 hypothetical protein [Ranid herpesvirus 3]